MSRSGYTDDYDYDNWASIRWRGAVASAIRGQRGQRFIREAIAALDAMPEKRLAARTFEASGDFCTLGVIGQSRGVDLSVLNAECDDDYQSDVHREAAGLLGISRALAAEVMEENDECADEYEWHKAPFTDDFGYYAKSVRVAVPDVADRRWRKMRDWLESQLREKEAATYDILE